MAAGPILVRMHAGPGAFLFQRQFQNRGPVLGDKGFPDLVAFAFLAEAFRIAGVIGQDFLGPVTRRQMQQEHLRPLHRAIGPRRHAGEAEKLAVKNQFAFKTGAKADIDDLVVAGQQRRGCPAHPFAAQPLGGRQMGVIAEQIAQLGLADAPPLWPVPEHRRNRPAPPAPARSGPSNRATPSSSPR